MSLNQVYDYFYSKNMSFISSPITMWTIMAFHNFLFFLLSVNFAPLPFHFVFDLPSICTNFLRKLIIYPCLSCVYYVLWVPINFQHDNSLSIKANNRYNTQEGNFQEIVFTHERFSLFTIVTCQWQDCNQDKWQWNRAKKVMSSYIF